MTKRTRVVFFDIGDTLGSTQVSPPPYRLEQVDVYPYVPDVLKQLSARGLRLGVISNTLPDDTTQDMRSALEAAGIYPQFNPDLLLYSSTEGVDKSSVEIFRRAAERAGVAPNRVRLCWRGEPRAQGCA